MRKLTIKLPETDLHRRALLQVLKDFDYYLPLYTVNATVTIRLVKEDDVWSVYSALCAARHVCDAAPKELAGLSVAVDTVLTEMEAILDEEQAKYQNASL